MKNAISVMYQSIDSVLVNMTIKETLEKHGVHSKDIPKAIFTFEVMGTAGWIGTLALCYKYNPLGWMANNPPTNGWIDNLRNKYPERFDRTFDGVMKTSERIANNKYFRMIPDKLGLNRQRFTLAVAENFIINKLTLPFLLPAVFWLVVRSHRSEKVTGHGFFRTSREVYSKRRSSPAVFWALRSTHKDHLKDEKK